jgi:hypothetical protein
MESISVASSSCGINPPLVQGCVLWGCLTSTRGGRAPLRSARTDRLADIGTSG